MKLTVANVDFSYNSHPVLSDVSFSLDRGQVMCVLGVNGAGKSTLLKCLNRILTPHRGSVLVDGDDLLRMSQNNVARRVGYVPQRHPETRLSVFEAVLMGRKPHIRWSLGAEDYALVEDIITQMGISDLAMRSVSDLSGGELQKVIIARALAQSPAVLLLDEPTSNLDLKNQLEVMELICRIVETQNLSAVVAIHDLNIALRFADRFVFLKEQSVHAVSTREDLDSEMIWQVYGVRVALREFAGHTVVVPM
ncbi:metal ABC transporter, ATP-binding protein [Syntrophotalea carbinolica DSM 2380]|uniref:Metal ABC transporter, ATP-binding protein n=1 Tax=Syntrophotalea carbinolica (strain DSM 2380 / NBRC 103641 / GraBd1) TaxID=338963 RepID=Q3A015_SYNC1|nr:ABC transporter ATP-binding protein [Syntrophotalea carbinolica]ABA90292.1 metal ABC transporter, ATP-binding protein [Syntrophotalea carbinolica DSM 2380]